MSTKLFFKMRYLPAIVFALMAAPVVQAATSPSLGAAASYSVLSGAAATNGGAGTTTISGNFGVYPAAAYNDTAGNSTVFLTPANPHLGDVSAQNAQAAQLAVFNGPAGIDAVSQPCTTNYAVTQDLTGLTLDPGVYCTPVDFLLSGTLTLHGTGSPATDVWIFRSARDFVGTGTANVVFSGTGGVACNVWWRLARDATFTANLSMVGNVLAANSITLGQGTTINGRAFAYTAAVTLLGNTISGPTCAVAQSGSSALPAPIINLTKIPSPLALPNGPGSVKYTYSVTNPGLVSLSSVTVKDDKCSSVVYVSGDSNHDSLLDPTETWTYTCTTTLNQTTANYAMAQGFGSGLGVSDTAIAEVIVGVPVVPPLIHIVKTPSPFTLPFNGGSVTYSYAVTNPGTVALSNVTVSDNKCSNVTFVSGDSNGDSRLQSGESWRYTCTMNVPQTMTNTAVATGQANGLTAIDTALATVTVAGSPVPPLINIIKKPEPAILPASGGLVVYTYTVTNPGTVTLNNLSVSDDKCSSMRYVSGDINGNSMMETNETWTYTCQQSLSASTINTATAQGSANGLTVTAVAVASVVLSPALIPPVPAAPAMPNTGFGPMDSWIAWTVAFAGMFVAGTLLFALTRNKKLS